MTRARLLTAASLAFLLLARAPGARAAASYHLIGWANAFIPGAGRAMLGDYKLGAFQATYEIGTFAIGYSFSDGQVFSLDGFTFEAPTKRLRRTQELGVERNLYGDIFQEFAIKSHMVNTFEAYRLAAKREDGTLPSGIDDEPALGMFLEPFKTKNLTSPWVYTPMAVVAAYCTIDYLSQVGGTVSTVSRLTPYSNFLYGFNYGIWQPMGSGAPEEMFFRGFLQNEFLDWTHTPYAAIPMSTALFALSHAPSGRLSASVAGAYLGYLAYRNNGRLGPGITVHFWSDLMLGLETILLNDKGERVTPPATFTVQINY